MAHKSSLLYRAIAVVRLVGVALALVRTASSEQLLERMQDPTAADQAAEIFHQFRFWLQVGWWTDLLLGFVVLVLLALIAFALRGGRGVTLAAAGVVLMVLSLATTVGDQIAESLAQDVPGTLRRMIWIALNVAQMAALGFPIAAGISRVKRAGPALRILLALFITFAVAGSLFSGVMFFSEQPGDTLRWFVRIGWIGAEAVFVAAAWLLANQFRKEPPRPATSSLTGSGLRVAAWAMLARVVVMVLGGGSSGMAAGMNSFGAAKIALVLTSGLGAVASVAILLGLASCIRLPKEGRLGAALGVAIATMLIGIGLDFWSTSAGLEIYGMSEVAAAARSIWEMPSVSRMDSLSQVLLWAGRAGQLLGLAGAVALVLSLRKTARWVAAEVQTKRADLLIKLIVGVSIATLVLGFLVQARLDPAYIITGLGSLAVAAGAVTALVLWMRLLFGLARLVDDKQGATAALG